MANAHGTTSDTPQPYCDICDQDVAITYWDICEDCWLESAQPGGVHADLPLTLVVEGDETACEDLTLGAFMADNAGVLGPEEIHAVRALPVGESLTFGGGAAPVFWLSRRAGTEADGDA